ncbi:MAG: alpha/beta hydrolase, partial [Pseudomonadota bacterium]
DDEIGRLFAQSLSLTSAEQAIAKAVVSQTTLRQLAKVRGRSIGTVRNQLKRLLAKLGLNSQTGLLSLYAAFAKFHHGDIKGRREAYKRDGKRTLQVLKLSNDYTLAVDTWGDDPLKPVLYLHPLIGGTSLTEQAKTVFAKAGYRLIMPWRPNYGSTDDCGSGLEQLSVYSDYLVEVLGHYGVERCPVIAANGAAPFGAAFASHHPDRCSGLIISAGAIPLTVDAQLNLMSMQLKVAYYVAKHSESIFRLYLRSTMNAIEAGFEESYARHFFERSVRDQETATSPEFRRLVVNAFSYCYLNGHDGALQDFVLNRTDWVSNYGSIGPRTHLIYGDDDSQHPPALIKQFARQLGGASYEIAEDAGSLVIYQAPETFVQALDRI